MFESIEKFGKELFSGVKSFTIKHSKPLALVGTVGLSAAAAHAEDAALVIPAAAQPGTVANTALATFGSYVPTLVGVGLAIAGVIAVYHMIKGGIRRTR